MAWPVPVRTAVFTTDSPTDKLDEIAAENEMVIISYPANVPTQAMAWAFSVSVVAIVAVRDPGSTVRPMGNGSVNDAETVMALPLLMMIVYCRLLPG